MKILYHHRTQAEDGQAVHIRSLQAAWRELGHEIIEVSLVAREDGAAPQKRPEPKKEPARFSPWGLVAKAPRFVRELAEYSYTPFARAKLVQAIRKERPDFLYERYAFGNAGGVMAAAKTGIPIVLEVNSPMVIEHKKNRGLSMEKTAERLEQFIFKSATRVCVVSDVLADMVVEMGVPRQNVFVTPNGVHLEQYAYPDRAEARRRARTDLGLGAEGVALGFVGYYRDWHRLDIVVDALRDLPEASLVLVGEGPARESLEARARELGVLPRVRFAGPREHGSIPGLLPAFDVALVPAINAYASPLKLHEYMAAGLAIVAPDQPNIREVLTDGEDARLVRPGEYVPMLEALQSLVGDPALRARLGDRARSVVEERDLTWRGNALRVLRAVEEAR